MRDRTGPHWASALGRCYSPLRRWPVRSLPVPARPLLATPVIHLTTIQENSISKLNPSGPFRVEDCDF